MSILKRRRVIKGKDTYDPGVITINPPMQSVFWPCDYCGGWWSDPPGGRAEQTTESISILLSHTEMGVLLAERKVCIKCFIKLFDTVLGPPKEKP